MGARTLDRAKNTALRLLKVRNRSAQEIRRRLKAKRFSASVIQQTVAYLKNLKYLDDRQFARNWITTRLKKPLGIHRITAELKERGVAQKIIEAEMARCTNGYQETAIISEMAQRRAERYEGVPREKMQQRVFAYLVRRGFNIEAVQQIVKQL